MQPVILDEIALNLDVDRLIQRLRLGGREKHSASFQRLADEAQGIAHPKALYKVASIDAWEDTALIVDGVQLTSRVLAVNLTGKHRVFPYLATCGAELDAWERSLDDMLWRYWANVIKEAALTAAMRALGAHLKAHYNLGQTSAMSPGSLQDWPIHEQRSLFKLLGDTQALIGVELTESCLMVPNKSVSGLRFSTDVRFESCQLCPRDGCPGRRAPYDATLYERRYQLNKGSAENGGSTT